MSLAPAHRADAHRIAARADGAAPVVVRRPPDPARWVAALYATTLVLQRVSVPGTEIAIALPIMLGWSVLALRVGVLEFSVRRLVWWLAAFGGAGLVVLLQVGGGFARYTSVGSWLLFAVCWACLTLRMRDRRRLTFDRTVDACLRVGLGLAGLSVAFVAVQFLGVGYVDVVAGVVPSGALVPGFVTTYPLVYGSGVMRSNAWIGLEASIVSFHLGALLVLAVMRGKRLRVLGVLGLGMVVTASGSGVIVAAIGLAVLAVTGHHRLLRPLLVPGLVGAAVLALTPFGQSLFGRSGELSSSDSSSSLRAVRGYVDLYPQWRDSLARQWFGCGPGSAQHQVDTTGVTGLVAPTGTRLFFDYGLLVGVALLGLLVVSLCRSHAPALAVGLGVSFVTLQPATTTVALILVMTVFVTWWSPPLEPAPPRPPRRVGAGPCDGPDPSVEASRTSVLVLPAPAVTR